MTVANPAIKTKPRSQRLWYRTLQNVHLWIGLILCLPLAVLGITGSILVFEHELNDLTAEKPAQALAIGEMKSPSAILEAAKAAAPAGTNPSFLSFPEEKGEPATVRLSASGRPGPAGSVLVDPVSLEVLGVRTVSDGFLRQVHMLHANFLIRDRSGRELVGWAGAAMLVLGVSGLVLWWPRPGRWKDSFKVKAGAKGARFHRDLHGAVGIWSLAVFIVVSFSGVYLAFPQTLGDGVSALLPARDLRAPVKVEPMRGSQPIGLDQAVAIATAAVPGAEVRMIALATRPDQALRIGLVRPGHEHGAPAIAAFVDPWRAKLVELRDPKDYSAGETVLAWQRPLHAGEGLGLLWKWAVFLSGILPPLFAITGTAMWWLKRKNRKAKDAERAAALAAAE